MSCDNRNARESDCEEPVQKVGPIFVYRKQWFLSIPLCTHFEKASPLRVSLKVIPCLRSSKSMELWYSTSDIDLRLTNTFDARKQPMKGPGATGRPILPI